MAEARITLAGLGQAVVVTLLPDGRIRWPLPVHWFSKMLKPCWEFA